VRFGTIELNGEARWGVVTDAGVVPVDGDLRAQYPSLRDAIAADALGEVAKQLAGKAAAVSSADATWLPVIPNPDKVLCIGLNYHEHRLEGGHPERDNPTIFTRFANAQMGHNQPMVKPKVSDRLDYEAELAVIIGKGGRHISEKNAMNHVAGYACFNDGSVRDWQRHTTQFTPGKNFVSTGGFGPEMVTADEIKDLGAVTLEARLNGNVMQHASVDMMIYSIPEQIAYISTFTRLEPGDVIATGTPGGVGSRRDPQVYMFPGDVIEIEISGVGLLSNPIVAEEG
jgi:2-keto-4-pentenoate hydratase/2-oxohepta-3-ene-1,7-dioic acid hydratase in catechol pathway